MSHNLPPLLRMRDIRKSFGSTMALDGVGLDLFQGEVLALVGENGAGKSTLLKILSGAHKPDSGTVEMDGGLFAPGSPLRAREQGVAMIYQELSLAPHLTVHENIHLGRDIRRWGILGKRAEKEIASAALARTGHTGLPLDRKVSALNPAERQVVEIARALAGKARILIMDEPTSSLTAVDTRNLFKAIHELKQQGVSILYVSHFLEEVAEVADRVVVLRDGRSVGEGSMKELTIPQIIHWMVGREIEEMFPKVPHEPGEVLLKVDGLSGVKLPVGACFEVRRGEILGIGGLVGAGRSELLRAIFGLEPVRSGSVRVSTYSGDLAGGDTPSHRWKAGIGMVSEDRKTEGLATGLSIAENLCLTHLRPYTHMGIFLPWLRHNRCEQWVKDLGIVCKSSDQLVSALSGGNQQKVAFGRLLHHNADLLLLDEPTRGIDVSSKAHLYRLIGEAAAQGKAVVMVSSYLPELFGVCDRLAVMRRGILSKSRPVSEWTEDEMMRYAVAEVTEEGTARG
jgi:ribose transport system ATP-binding protein